MPRQNSLIKISGKMGDLIHYYRKDRKGRKDYLVRRAPVTVNQTPATKRAAIDFGTASRNGSIIRNAIQEYTQHCYDNTLHYRLNEKMGEVVCADINHPAGQRMLTGANLQSLHGFRFNSTATVDTNYINYC